VTPWTLKDRLYYIWDGRRPVAFDVLALPENGTTMSYTYTDLVRLTIAHPVDDRGFPAALVAVPTWTAASGAVKVTPAADSLSAVIDATAAGPGVQSITVAAGPATKTVTLTFGMRTATAFDVADAPAQA
jgi:hypothetical protein